MRFRIDVSEGDWSDVSHGSYGENFSWALDRMIEAGEFDPAPDSGRWRALDRRTGRDTFVIVVPGDAGTTTVGELASLCLAEARRSGAARPAPPSPGPAHPGPLSWGDDAVLDAWLSDPASDERLPASSTLEEAGLQDGDLLVLSIEHPARGCYSMSAPRNPDQLFRWLQLAENSTAPAGGPRLWGVLLYTDADVELATYVRSHFDDLNVLSGPATRVFVVERRADWPQARKYWRRHLEPELYRVMSTMHWLRWTPYDPQGAYEVAARLGLGPELLPCLVFFPTPEDGHDRSEKIVFPVGHTSTAYLRTLFGEVRRTLAAVPPVRRPEDEGSRRLLERHGPTSEYYRYASLAPRTDTYAPAAEAVENLLAPGPASDRAAFLALREAEHTIKAKLRSLVPAPAGLTIENSLVVVPRTAGAEVPDNFYFQGEHTTFVNRPRSAVLRDFQNTYASTAHADDLVRLLRLVLESQDTPAPDREEAAAAIHELARMGTAAQPDAPAAATRLERLRTLLASSADIAQPALAILASLGAFFSG